MKVDCKGRTVVGSGYGRRALPSGPEARERAAKHCRFWGRHTPTKASFSAAWSTPLDDKVMYPRGWAEWLPVELRGVEP